jgi:hypothetical protein
MGAKLEIRIPKLETNSNGGNPKPAVVKRRVLNFVLSQIDVCFEFRASNFGFVCMAAHPPFFSRDPC